MSYCYRVLLFSLLFFGAAAVQAEVLCPTRSLDLQGAIAEPLELSGITIWRDLMIVCPDEGAEFNVFKDNSEHELLSTVNLLDGGDEEIDMEAAASDAEHIYIIGSHSIRRRLVDPERTYRQNRRRLSRVVPHTESYRLFRIQLDDAGQLAAKESIDLRDILENDEILGPFLSVPGKENGIDIEGIAVKNGKLFVGFRGPVLRGNFVPVLAFRFDEPDDYELLFMQLGGRGIRDLVAVEDGFLIVAGAIGDGDASYQLCLWNGEDGVPGEGGWDSQIVKLGELATELGIKPEGLAVSAETANEWRLLVVNDGDASATEWIVSKPEKVEQ
ncbi:MAG TPA: DUF3616 domain-containing protein [Lacipirellulaceae bacterium]